MINNDICIIEPYGIKLESEENKMTRITVLIKAMTCGELEASLAATEDK